jgi:hypothetical protein
MRLHNRPRAGATRCPGGSQVLAVGGAVRDLPFGLELGKRVDHVVAGSSAVESDRDLGARGPSFRVLASAARRSSQLSSVPTQANRRNGSRGSRSLARNAWGATAAISGETSLIIDNATFSHLNHGLGRVALESASYAGAKRVARAVVGQFARRTIRASTMSDPITIAAIAD